MNKKLKLETGKRIGKWEIISQQTKRKNNLTHWLCRCECGTEEYIPLNNLMNGSSTQCINCSTKQSGKKRRKGYELISGDYWSQIKTKAKRKKLIFEIRIEEAWDLFVKQNGKCELTNNKIELTGYPYDKNKTTAILSLIKPELGFVKDNVMWIHKNVAKLKGDMDKDQFMEIIYEIYAKDAYN